MASGIYNVFKLRILQKRIDLVNDDIKVALLNNSHTFNRADQFWTGIHEISGINYTTGGQFLAGKTLTILNNKVYFDANNVIWFHSTITAYHAVLYNSYTSDLIATFQFGGSKQSSNNTFRIKWNIAGILSL